MIFLEKAYLPKSKGGGGASLPSGSNGSYIYLLKLLYNIFIISYSTDDTHFLWFFFCPKSVFFNLSENENQSTQEFIWQKTVDLVSCLSNYWHILQSFACKMVELSTRPPFLNIIIILILSLRSGSKAFGAQFWVIFLKLSLHKMAIGQHPATL